MMFVPDLRCPNSECLEKFTLGITTSVLRFEQIAEYKRANHDHVTDSVYECPFCHLVWTQSSAVDPGFHAVPQGFHLDDSIHLLPIPDDVHMVEPGGHRVSRGRSKRR